ncbi:MAG: acyltransferase [Chitinophagales bacterium]|nr:acyltransferase [Chitinophagales bacterium]MCZ2394252.1 acyltransferase [Chitinophagales bacterium]
MTNIQPLKYFPAFDGVRGLFCILIISHHWVMPYLQGPFTFMWWLLQVFFMLSAYLITRILLYDKTRMSNIALFKRFYSRRILRIFPLYFLYVFLIGGLLLLAGTTGEGNQNPDVLYFKQNWGFLLTYTYNFTEIANHFRDINYIPAPLFSHLWSLSLEEQFYMVIPFAILMLPMQHLKKVVIFFIIFAPFIRWLTYDILQGIDQDTHWLGLISVRNTLFQMDTLAYGMAVAIFDVGKIKNAIQIFLSVFIVWIIYTFVSAHFIVEAGGAKSIHLAIKEYTFMTFHKNYIFYFTLTNIMCALFVITVVNNTITTRMFSNKPLIFLGRISYGIYVWHYFVMLLAAGVLHPLIGSHHKYIGNFWAELAMYSFFLALLILIAHLSYKYFESYFIKLKAKT